VHAYRLAGQNGMTALMYASASGHVEAVRVLIEKGANLEAADKVRIHSHATTHMHAHNPSYTYTCIPFPANAQSSPV
jgi:hypothetical protein